jgi:hypothetical protein
MALALLSALGCAARYHEPARLESSASLQANSPLWVTAIDGKKVSQLGFTGEKHFRVTPGQHILRIRLSDEERQQFYVQNRYVANGYNRILSTNDVSLHFKAQAGHAYYLHGDRNDMDKLWRPFVTESSDPVFRDWPPVTQNFSRTVRLDK